MGFRWDPATFDAAAGRFDQLAGEGQTVTDLIETQVLTVGKRGNGGFFNIVMWKHPELASEVYASSLCVPDMLHFLSRGIRKTYAIYDKSENDAAADVDGAWRDGLERPHGPDNSELEQHADPSGRFGTAVPDPPYWYEDGYPISDVVNRIIDLDFVPDGPPKSPAGRIVWDYLWNKVGIAELETLGPMLLGDWSEWQAAGGTLTELGRYWPELAAMCTADAGTFFRGWDGAASEHVEPVFEAIFGLLQATGPPLHRVGRAYRAHAYGVYLLTDELNTDLFELVDLLRIAVGVLDLNPLETSVALVAARAAGIIGKISEKAAKIFGIVVLILRLLRAFVAVVTLVIGEFGGYRNKMWGYRLA